MPQIRQRYSWPPKAELHMQKLLIRAFFKMHTDSDQPVDGHELGPTSRNLSLTSFKVTSIPANRAAVQMPLPMSPPPRTASFFTGRGFNPASVTPLTFLVDRCAKNMCTRALWVSREAAFPKFSTSYTGGEGWLCPPPVPPGVLRKVCL